MAFPVNRPRRMRRTETLRRMMRETRLAPEDFILPLFVCPGRDVKKPVASMPGVAQMSVDNIVKEAKETYEAGVPGVILFGIPEHKDEQGSSAWHDDGEVQRAIRELKERVPGLAVITDVCLCEYTDHGHCGVVADGDVDNDATLELLVREAISHARAGADIVAPSDMMDGRVGAIRDALDQEGFHNVAIMAYSAKFASAFYGPFREAAESTPQFGDRRSYQMDPPNGDEAIREVMYDIEEGADIVMVKPALVYLDLIWRVKQEFGVPLAAYNVSGEYSMIRAAGINGWLDEKRATMEVLTAIKRAGADLILTYFAKEAARALTSQHS
jgi:porphobilinogen synthase